MSKEEKVKCKNPLCKNYFKSKHGHMGLCPKCCKNLIGGEEVVLGVVALSLVGYIVQKVIFRK